MRLRWALADDYEVLAALGAGSFGSVWRVRDLTLGREVALKLLHPHVARDERIVGRFRREAKLAAQLAHPAIVPIFDWDSRGDVAWYTMELAEGGSVADLVARSGPRALTEIAPQVDFILNGLAAAHSIGIIHRDLKPENVLIDRYRRWRLADFGIANVTGEETAGASGTPAFAPPEQLLGEAQDAAADCFSLAAIVAFALTGTPPFGERDSASILAREMRGDVDLSAYPTGDRRVAAPRPRGDAGRAVRGCGGDAGRVARGGSGRVRARPTGAVVASLVRARDGRGRRVDGRLAVHVQASVEIRRMAIETINPATGESCRDVPRADAEREIEDKLDARAIAPRARGDSTPIDERTSVASPRRRAARRAQATSTGS